jgi:DNA-binding NarL/FixJ family response regulator
LFYAQRTASRSAARDRPILVIDADNGCRRRIAATFRRAGYTVREAETAAQGRDVARLSDRILAAIIAVELPDATGYELCREIRDDHGDQVAIFFLSATRTDAADRVAGLLVGADDYLAKPVEPDELLVRLRQMTRVDPSRQRAFDFTPREFEVLALLGRGLAQGQIAAELVISPRTVGTHIHHILRKFGVHSRAEAVALAHRHGLVGAFAAIFSLVEACLQMT